MSNSYRVSLNDPTVVQITEEVAQELGELETRGKTYSGLHPAFCILVICMLTQNPKIFQKMEKILKDVGAGNKSVGIKTKIQRCI
jgi:hypothetical protein